MTSSYLTWEGEIGSIVLTNLLGNDFVHHDAPHEMHQTLPSLQIPRRPTDFSLPFRDLNLLGALHVRDDFLWHSKAFDPIVGLLVHLDGHHLVIFLLLQEIRCGGLLVTLLV